MSTSKTDRTSTRPLMSRRTCVMCVHVQPDVVLSEHDMCVGHA